MKKSSDKKSIKQNFFILGLIVCFGLFLRIFKLGDYPPALNWDEVSHGYNAYSILKTGKDEWGKFLPLVFKAYGDYKLPVYIYTTVFSIFIFGLNDFAVRLPSALAGVGTILFTYLLAIIVFEDLKKIEKEQIRKIALISSFLVAIEPWTLFLSRGAFEANLALFFFVSGIYFLFAGLRSPKFLIISSLLLGLTVWTYNSYRIFTPLILGAFAVIYRFEIFGIWKKSRNSLSLSILLLVLFLMPMFFQLGFEEGQARYLKVTLIDEGAINYINEKRMKINLNPASERLLYNKFCFFLVRFANNWINHYSPNFLFLKGGSQYNFSLPDFGILYLINFPFFLLGLFIILKFALKRRKIQTFLLIWMLFAPIPASITRESPNVLRGITFLPLPMIIITLGFISIYSAKNLKWFISRKLFAFLYLAILLISLSNYLVKYIFEYPKIYSWSWQYGYKDVVEYVENNYEKYDKIIITKKYGEPHEFLLFYWPWDPKKYQKDGKLIRFFQSGWYWVDRFDKFYFVNDWEIPKESDVDFKLESGQKFDCLFGECLLVTSPGNYPKDWKLLKTIYFLDGKPAFEILEN